MNNFLRSLALAIVVFAIHAFCLLPSAQGEVTQAGKEFVELLSKGDFPGAVARFDPTMKSAMPEPKLRQTWQVLQTQAGPFQKQLGARASTLGGYDVAFVTCQFQKMMLDLKVVFDANGKVAGLFFLPSQGIVKPEAAPSYALANSYRETNFTVGHAEWRLPSTLTLPTTGHGPWPAVVLVHGSGPEDRDETAGANKPFRDLAWGLASKGVAVLRYEKRVKEYKARFMTPGFYFTVREETIDDALSAAAQLRATDGIDAKRVFVLGHSLGGMLVPRIAQADPKLAGLIILAGATRPLEDLVVEQTRYVISLNGKPSPEAEKKLAEVQTISAKIKNLTTADAKSSVFLFGAPPSYWLDLQQYDPPSVVKETTQPLLILQGGRDYQVTQVDYNRWKVALASRPDVTFKFYPALNHLFITGTGPGTPDDYEQPGHVAEAVVSDIAEWIKRR